MSISKPTSVRYTSPVKGIVLAGGTGSRLFPLTKITNKHLLPIFDKPMVYYPIQTLVDAGITDIMLVTGGRNSGDFLRLLGNGKEFGLKHLNYTYQEGEGGIAEALALCEHFADGDKVCVILGDNLIEGNIRRAVDEFRQQERGARIFLKEVVDAQRFGVAELSGGRVVSDRGKTQAPEEQLRGDGNLSLRRYRVRQVPHTQALAPGRARNYRREQRVYLGRNHELRDARRLVDRCRHLRFALARGKSGGRATHSRRSFGKRGVISLLFRAAVRPRRSPGGPARAARFPSPGPAFRKTEGQRLSGLARKIWVTPLRRAKSTSASAWLSLSSTRVSMCSLRANSRCRSGFPHRSRQAAIMPGARNREAIRLQIIGDAFSPADHSRGRGRIRSRESECLFRLGSD